MRKKIHLYFTIALLLFVVGSCKKAKDPMSLTLRVESTCSFNLTYYLYYGSKYDPFYVTKTSTWERLIKVYEGNKILMKGEKDSNGTDSNPVVIKIYNGTQLLVADSSAIDKEEIKVEYTYQ